MVLLGLAIAMLLASGFYFLANANRTYAFSAQTAADAAVLLEARNALLSRAVSDANRPGSLPCPAQNSDGVAVGLPPCQNFVGWLPWRTLGLPDLRDSSGERLWYVLSPAFQDNGTVNSNSVSALTLDGATGFAALIIAPGSPLPGQNRPSNNASDYLDAKGGNPASSNSDGNDSYFSGTADGSFNDKVQPLTTAQLFSSTSRRILGEIRYAYVAGGGLAVFADSDGDGISNAGVDLGAFPYRNPAYNISSPSWYPTPALQWWYKGLEDNGWFPLVSYNRLTRSISLNGQVVALP